MDRNSSFDQRVSFGKQIRREVPRTAHAGWIAPSDRLSAVALLEKQTADRLNELVPLRNTRMAESPFAFFRGSAVVMAADLSHTPASGINVQLCGDAHCLNFGAFATAERRLIFDINDFDETLPGPWEWDVKRLATSFILAAREIGLKERDAQAAALAALQAYRTRLGVFAKEPPLNVWYARLDAVQVLNEARSDATRKRRNTIADQAATETVATAVQKFTEMVDGCRGLKDDPPELFHSTKTEDYGFDVERIFAEYALTLRDDIRFLFERYTLVDHAIKVVGIGSVGSRCALGLFESHDDDAILLQVKQATRSVLEPHLQRSAYQNQGERVVQGQRLMQAASDAFLGWSSSGHHDFYVRQFKDMKSSVDLDAADKYQLREYGQYCGWAVAAGHARSGDAAAIWGYIGRSDLFDKSIIAFAMDYASQVERDFGEFAAAADSGTTEAA